MKAEKASQREASTEPKSKSAGAVGPRRCDTLPKANNQAELLQSILDKKKTQETDPKLNIDVFPVFKFDIFNNPNPPPPPLPPPPKKKNPPTTLLPLRKEGYFALS